jgi:two-component system, NtrC family, sensor histidine kinase HydH
MWRKVVTPTLLVSFLWLAGSTLTSHFVQQVYEFHSQALEENVTSIRAAWAMQDVLWRLHAVVVEAGGKEQKETQVEANELENAFLRHLTEAEKSAYTPAEKAAVKAAGEHFSLYRDHIANRLRSQGLGGLLGSQAAEKEKTMRLARAVAEPCRQLLELNERMLTETTNRSTRLARSANMLRQAFLIAGPVVGIFCGLWVARGLHRSISQISVTLRDATDGLDRDVGSVEVRSSDGLPALQQQVQIVTNRIRKVAEELQEARQHAISAESLAAAGELAAGIAHEIRNPLTSVKLLIQAAAQRHTVPEWLAQDLQVAQREIARIEETIQGLLEFARPPDLNRVSHDLWRTIQRSLNLMGGRANQHNVTVEAVPPGEPVIVDGDPDQLHQILVNMLLNAIEAMPEGGRLRVSLENVDSSEGVCRVVIRDSGAGIPTAILPRIFEPFVSTKPHGTGLGLAISHRIAEEHGGKLVAANQGGGGAVFTLELPRCRPDNEQVPVAGNGFAGKQEAAIERNSAEVSDAYTPGH